MINVNGVAFKHFLKVVRSGFFIKCVVFTDRDTGTRTQERATELKKEFDQPDLIQVEITEDSTFEKDLIIANRSGEGRRVLLEALKTTKPERGKELVNDLGNQDIDVETFFWEIEAYKSEFAFNLLAQLEHPQNSGDLTIPRYIQRGFKFMG